MSGVKDQIRTFVVQHFMFGEGAGLADEASFLERGIIDSTGVLELIAHIESTYGIKIADHEMVPSNLDSVASLTAFVSGKLKPAGV